MKKIWDFSLTWLVYNLRGEWGGSVIYDLDKNSFYKIIEEVSKKRQVNKITLKTDKKFFKHMDEIHPAWSSLLALRAAYDVRKGSVIRKNIPPNFLSLIDLTYYLEYMKNHEIQIDVVKRWGSNLVDIWAPFAERRIGTLKESNNKWGDVEKLNLTDESFESIEIQIGRALSKKEKESIIMTTKDRMQNIFNAHGELYANSVTHGFHKPVTSAQNSGMVSFISHQANGDIVLFHADLGMSIEKRTEKVVSMPAKKRVEWALGVGNSSKDPKESPIRGLGTMFLKSIKAVDPINDIVGISGNYKIDFKINDKKIDADEEDKFKVLDEAITPLVTRNNFEFPGTAWFIKFKAGKASYGELKEIMNFLDETRKEEMESVKEYII